MAINDRYPDDRAEMNRKAADFGFNIGVKLKLAQKREKMQAWAEEYPIISAFATITIAAVFLLTSAFPLFPVNDDGIKETSAFDVIEETSNTLSSLHKAQAGKAENRELYNAIALSTIDLKEEFDSLVALPHKTHEDSMRIKFVGFRLKQILNDITAK